MSTALQFSESGSSPGLTIQQRAKLIRAATPNGDTLENLFEMQNRICDLCGQPIQDLILAALDHSTPVIHFARSTMPIEDAIAQASDPKNLRCAHSSCNSAKNGLTRGEWFRRGLNVREAPRFLTDGQLLELQFRLGVGGRTAGFANAKNKTGVCGRSPEKMRADASKSGRKQSAAGTGMFTSGMSMRSAVIGRITGNDNKRLKRGICSPGVAAKGGRIGGRINGRKMKQEGRGIFAPENRGLGGRKAKEMGVGVSAMTHEQLSVAGRVGGGTGAGGRKCAEKKVGVCGRSPEKMREDGLKGVHTYWHVRRGIVNPKCKLCVDGE
jgi:hypothetical protein